jgi:hypothetical protein
LAPQSFDQRGNILHDGCHSLLQCSVVRGVKHYDPIGTIIHEKGIIVNYRRSVTAVCH